MRRRHVYSGRAAGDESGSEKGPLNGDIYVWPVRDNIYTLAGDEQTSSWRLEESRPFVVDTGRGALADKTIAAIRRLSDKPIQFIARASAIGLKAGVGDELNWLVTQATDRRDRLVCQRATPAIDDKRPFASSLHDDVSFVAGQHVDVVADGPDVNLSITRLRVHCLTRHPKPCRWTFRRPSFEAVQRSPAIAGYIVATPPNWPTRGMRYLAVYSLTNGFYQTRSWVHRRARGPEPAPRRRMGRASSRD